MGDEVRQIHPVPLTRDEWAPFGWLPVADTDPSDGDHRLEFAWQDVHVNRIGHRRDEVPSVAGGLRCEVLFRHATHTQVVMPLDVTAVVVVAPAEVAMRSSEDVDEVKAFVTAITEGLPSPVPGENGLILNAIFDAIYKSSDTGNEDKVDVSF